VTRSELGALMARVGLIRKSVRPGRTWAPARWVHRSSLPARAEPLPRKFQSVAPARPDAPEAHPDPVWWHGAEFEEWPDEPSSATPPANWPVVRLDASVC
jgi:hypothetical protein